MQVCITRFSADQQPEMTTVDDIVLVCANFGGIDEFKALPPHPGLDALYFTDATTAAQASASGATWTRVETPDYPRADFSPRLRSRYFKHQIHRIDGVERYRYLAWADGSLQFHSTDFLVDFARRLDAQPSNRRLMLVPHPERQTVLEEYEFVRDKIARGREYLRIRYANENMGRQMEYYRAKGWNLNARLWCGTLWMVENNDAIRRCWDEWWDHNLRFGMMDQLSLPVLLSKHGLDPQALDIDLRDNPFFTKVRHCAPCIA